MSDPQRPEREAIERLRVLLEQATPAPWRAAIKPHPEAVRLKTEAATVSGPDCRIYTVARDYVCLPETWARQCADAELIVLLRNLAPALLAALPPTPTPGLETVRLWVEGAIRGQGEPTNQFERGYLEALKHITPLLPPAPTGERE
jgi:hypothetical protein